MIIRGLEKYFNGNDGGLIEVIISHSLGRSEVG